jgi:predicted small metal-binding protein
VAKLWQRIIAFGWGGDLFSSYLKRGFQIKKNKKNAVTHLKCIFHIVCLETKKINAVNLNNEKEEIMGRKYIDCRDYPSEIKCSVALSADTEEELLKAAVQHSVAVHGYEDTPEFRENIRKSFKEETPPAGRSS